MEYEWARKASIPSIHIHTARNSKYNVKNSALALNECVESVSFCAAYVEGEDKYVEQNSLMWDRIFLDLDCLREQFCR